ncbi:unnamed protein product [Medioppia subpectinata]|uniref:Ran-specific GTPase-activating protein n=1 Tax=Medioppia subpectinata TaxID=1979941 RepID=A0A7R9PXN7_9ACAR|nr:unnamed protein product [Medioppia subpectinata]CAG2104569.1 unnamed protein product [Medioppia subpectinata]
MSDTTPTPADKVEPTTATDGHKTDDAKSRERTESESADSNPDIHFDPIIQLPLIDLKSLEEDETELLKLRAKLYRYDTTEETPQFKERGTGEVKLLRHNQIRAVRILMRRDKTLKLCANHYIMPAMELKKHQNSEKVFVWSTFADLSDETPKPETLAIRFGNAENAQKFKEVFEESKEFVSDPDDQITNTLNKMHIKDENKSDTEDSDSEEDDSESETTKESADKEEVQKDQKTETKEVK